MNSKIYYTAILFSITSFFFAKGQEIGFVNKSDSIITSVSKTVNSPSDSLDHKLSSLKNGLQQKLDSLKAKGQPSESLQKKLDSLQNLSQLPGEQYGKLLSFQQQLKDSIHAKIPGLDSLRAITSKAKNAMGEVNQVSTEIGIGPLGQDLKPNLENKIPGSGEIQGLNAPSLKTNLPQTEQSLGKIGEVNTQLPETQVPEMKMPDVKTKINDLIPEKVEDLKENIGDISNTVKEAGGIIKEGEEYVKEIKTIQEEGLARSEKIPELAEQQLMKIDEVAALEQHRTATLGQMEEYKKLIEQYKEEKAIKEDLEKRSKELANDIIAKNQDKIDGSMKKIAKAKRKFPDVADMRNLPKRAPNVMKNLGWRERLVPGFTLHTFSTDRTWLQIDPQLFYKLNGNFSVGVGVMYRLSMNPGKIKFNDFKDLYGYKVFAQYHAYKGFWVRAEGQQAYWKPWGLKLMDPEYLDKTNVAAVGICKNYNIGKRIKGNTQALYHFTWNGFDPYKPKILIRLGFDFSIKKKDQKPWKKKLKQLKKTQR